MNSPSLVTVYGSRFTCIIPPSYSFPNQLNPGGLSMFCPVCESEYEEGVTSCPDDGSELVERLTAENTVRDHRQARSSSSTSATSNARTNSTTPSSAATSRLSPARPKRRRKKRTTTREDYR